MKCPFTNEALSHTTLGGDINAKWWPEQLNLRILYQNPPTLKPTDDFSYKKEFEKLDVEELKKDLKKLMRSSQDWWPADYGHYGPLFIRLSWHSAGTYRVFDGRGGGSNGNQRFAPLNSWPDNINLDKARRLLWPIKQKYGNKISWGDLLVLAGTVALEDMGFKPYGFAFGRVDIWEAEIDTYWGDEMEWLSNEKRVKDGELQKPLAADHMGLIYVNPEGPNGEPNILEAAKQIRESFKRMAMNDEETVALIAGGHTFGKNHGAAPTSHLGKEVEAAPIEEQNLGWKNSYKSGKGPDTITSGIEGAWTPTPTKWDDSFLRIMFKYDWNLVKSPAGAWQWEAVDVDEEDMVPDAHIPGKKHKPIMLTTDLALRMDSEYKKIAKKFLENPKLLEEAFAKAWFKLTHRDLGPKSRYLGNDIGEDDFIWQDPIPKSYTSINEKEIETLKKEILEKLSIQEILYTVFSAVSTYRDTDKRGGLNGARIRLKPQIDWEINQDKRVAKTIKTLEKIKPDNITFADLLALSGIAAIEKAAKNAGVEINLDFYPGRGDATQEETDIESFNYLKPIANGFLNYLQNGCEELISERALIDLANKLTLTVPEMTVLIGGLRTLGINYNDTPYGRFSEDENRLDNEFFTKLLDMNIEWKPKNNQVFEGFDRKTNKKVYEATRVDLIFGANSQLRAQSEFYAQNDNKEKFIKDFAKAFNKLLNIDRFDIFWR
ncbi:catalase/peroxidase HPI [Caminibacter mediatlanticus TB-2]|uniref:Catalase-peroxidase n=1 Tax=Caminibacter mediatlanticus TB-2 TaxID=391592 RepID=A0ABX5V5X5_9BACT|nr:catalase/peroxidase HPI [Caminibacter mediatlanticus]QCT93678.1 catalase/peroxidase HPI [Caminibacter mediatlanticus TB-2]